MHRDLAREEGVVAVYRTEQVNAKNGRWDLAPAQTDELNRVLPADNAKQEARQEEDHPKVTDQTQRSALAARQSQPSPVKTLYESEHAGRRAMLAASLRTMFSGNHNTRLTIPMAQPEPPQERTPTRQTHHSAASVFARAGLASGRSGFLVPCHGTLGYHCRRA
jgi:hypothetical protein